MGNNRQVIFVTIISILFCSCSPATIEPIPTVTSTTTDVPTRTPTDLPPTLTATVGPTKTPESTKCPLVGGPGSSWDRYKPNTFENVLTLANQASSPEKNPSISFYIETSGEHQIPSCVKAEYTGMFRGISEVRLFLIDAWSGIFGPDRKQEIADILKHEVLLVENGKEYWIPVQEPLIPYMEKELTKNESVIVFIIWVGSSYLSKETDHIFVIGEFTKP
jgi:hypothetical protein